MHGVHEAAGSSPVIPTILMLPQDDIAGIHARNKRVEADKAWETSWTRRGCVALLTYATATLFLWVIADTNPLVHALVPTGGYVLSTLSLPWVKQLWLRSRNQNGDR